MINKEIIYNKITKEEINKVLLKGLKENLLKPGFNKGRIINDNSIEMRRMNNVGVQDNEFGRYIL